MFEPTEPLAFEFYLSLRKLGSEIPAHEAKLVQRTAISEARQKLVKRQRDARLLAGA